MKVVLAFHDLGAGGAERVLSGLAAHLQQGGHEVGVLTLAAGEDFYPLAEDIRRLQLEEHASGGSVVGALLANGSRVRRMREAIRRVDADVVVSFMTTTNVLTVLATRGLRCAVVVSERTWPPAMPLGRAWGNLRRITYPWADRLVVLTQRTRDWAVGALAMDERMIDVIANPVQLPLPAHAPVVEPPTHEFLLAVGRLGPEKDFASLIDAYTQAGIAIPLVILGEGPQRAMLTARADRLGIRLELPGRVGNLADWYQGARALVLTSRFEGFPNVLIEAMSHGCPVVSVDCEVGPREIVRDGVDGLLVPPADPDALSSAISAIVNDDTLHRRLSSESGKIEQRFSAQAVFGAWELTLERAWSGSG